MHCGELLPLSMFYKHSGMLDGYLNKCKECTRTGVTLNRLEKIEKYREYDRERGNRQSPEYLREYRKANPEKYAAHTSVNNAIRDGKLFKGSCEVCGSDEGIHAHHEDYDKPLEVKWLCPVHHKAEHSNQP